MVRSLQACSVGPGQRDIADGVDSSGVCRGNVLREKQMVMENRIFDFLVGQKNLALATVYGDKPHVRVFRTMFVEGESLFFATSSEWEPYAELQINPSLELLAAEGNFSVRVEGKAHFDVSDEMARRIWKGSDLLQRLFSDYRDPVYFRVPVRKMHYYDISTNPPTQQFVDRTKK